MNPNRNGPKKKKKKTEIRTYCDVEGTGRRESGSD